MTKLEKLKSELLKVRAENEKLLLREKDLQEKIKFEEQEQLQKTLKARGLTYDDIMRLIDMMSNED